MHLVFIFLRRRERRLLVSLLVLLLLAFGGRCLFEMRSPQEGFSPVDSTFTVAADSFFASLYPLPSESLAYTRTPADNTHSNRAELPAPVLRPFDPNRADSATLVSLGLKPWMAHNIVRYRERGGRFRHPEQLLRIYGIDSTTYFALVPYVRLESEPTAVSDGGDTDSTVLHQPKKFESPIALDINSADTTLLRRIPGIGQGYARLIVSLRERLGGYYSVDQLFELGHLPDSLRVKWEPWLVADRSLIRKLRINRASVEKLRAHPYLNFYQARVIVDVRRRAGPFTSLQPLVMFDEFSEADLQRIEPYVSYE